MTTLEFDTFISYSGSQTQRDVAVAIENGLRRFARPWYKISALRVFRDTSYLTASHDLWQTIEQALSRSKSLIYLASPEAAASRWVLKELTWWLDHHGTNNLILVIIAGNIAATDDGRELDRASTDCIPQTILARFHSLPLYIDLRGSPSAEPLDPRHAMFAKALPQISAAVREVSLDHVTGEALRQRHLRNRAAASAVCLVAVLIGAAAFGFYRYEISARVAAATSLWNGLEFSTAELRPREIDALWSVAASDDSLFDEFWSQVKGNPSNIAKLGARPQLLARTAGLGISHRSRFSVDRLVDAMRVPCTPDQVLALASAVRAIPRQIDSAQAATILVSISKAIQAPIDGSDRSALVSLFTAFSSQLPPDQAAQILDGIPLDRLDFSDAIKALASRLSAKQANINESKAITALQGQPSPSQVDGLLNAVEVFAPRLASTHAADALGSILKVVASENDSRRRASFEKPLSALASRLTPVEAVPAMESLMHAWQTASDPYEFRALSKAINALSPQLPSSEIGIFLDHTINAIETAKAIENDPIPYRMGALLDAIGSLPVELTLSQSKAIFDRFSSVSLITSEVEGRALSVGIPAIAHKLKREQASVVLAMLVGDLKELAQRIQTTSRPQNSVPTSHLSLLVNAIVALPIQLSPSQADSILESVLGAAQADFDELAVVGELFPYLQPDQAANAVDRLLDVVRTTRDYQQLYSYVKAIKTLPIRLTPAQETIMSDAVFRMIESTTDPFQLVALAQLVGLFSVEPAPIQVGAVLDRFLTAIETSPNGAFIQGAAALPINLTVDQKNTIMEPHLALITGNDNKQMRALLEAIGSLPTRETSADIARTLDRLLLAFTRVDEFLKSRRVKSEQRFALIEALKVLSRRLSDPDRQKLLGFACKTLSTTGDDFGQQYSGDLTTDRFGATHWAEVIDTLLQMRPEAEHIAHLIAVLKYPTTAGRPTKVLLSGFRRRSPDAPESLDQAIQWIGAHFPQLKTSLINAPDPTCGSASR
ncbi:toll/interleukin-1 receptor domain-containing protein [Rhizobium ruizarguesonis]|uniref:toll/interleukin-1 receptor domain-containing protein n=1 Tax=Rhizobium ruizarguesonis TaxID=2081791 RepID=UPI0010323D1C|nr:toll/interleukin-1 receptor domain-containing protein [Rhizobium ruizarguesonis]NKL10889.1 TIR domain-containing protein [Rhizobium leguminosarum bv. viciae]NEJ03090.1 TIR domain-containing protein [Rhizobium ruizarguesonis]NEJ40206.1 TIR domain-containing protein [Rhizobium ruizarguesonis]TAT91684.1 TIR domain-containing protein [Rhizobium ruizarguesonis]TAZ03625.1 TIR domain-containing protein [Rhizobium ruizarguesonis]